MIAIITPKLKDELLAELISEGTMNVQDDIYFYARKLNTTPDIIEAVLDQFEEIGLLTQIKCKDGIIGIRLNAKSHDFYNHGGFTVQEEMLKANIQKLSNELDLLAKQLSPNFLEKARSISAIGANILTALSFFKS